jgi:hypothetical protein
MFTAVAKPVTPTVVPTVVPTALMHQNRAIAAAATTLANSLYGAFKVPFAIQSPFLSSSHLLDADAKFRVESAVTMKSRRHLLLCFLRLLRLSQAKVPCLGSSSSPGFDSPDAGRIIRYAPLCQGRKACAHFCSGLGPWSLIFPSCRLDSDARANHGGDVASPFDDRVEPPVIAVLGDQHVVHGEVIDSRR